MVGASGESNSSITIPTSERTNGTYIYFGKSALRVYQGSEFLIDPSIPRNAATFAKEVTALALNFYSATFGNLSRNPVVFLNHGTLHEGGASGSSQDGQFLVTVYGSGYQRDNAHPWESLAHTIIHEAVHQWNAIEIKDVSETDASWIWEGGAELLTWETLKDASLIDQARYEERLSRLRQACIDEIGSSSLMEMIDAKEYAKYRCGHYFQYLAVKLLQQHEKSQNAYSLWKALFDEALDNDRTYTIETYYEVLKSNLGEKLHRKVDSLKELINTPGTDLEAAELALGLN